MTKRINEIPFLYLHLSFTFSPGSYSPPDQSSTDAGDPTMIMNVDGSNPKLVESRGDSRKEAIDIYDHITQTELK